MFAVNTTSPTRSNAQPLSPDEAVAEMWAIENACLDGGDVTFNAASDMWWGVSVFCAHSDWSKYHKDAPYCDYAIAQATSGSCHGAFAELLEKFQAAHADIPRADDA